MLPIALPGSKAPRFSLGWNEAGGASAEVDALTFEEPPSPEGLLTDPFWWVDCCEVAGGGTDDV